MEKQNFEWASKVAQRQAYIASVLSGQSFEFICKNSRFIREELMYFLKYEKYLTNSGSQKTIDTQLKQCMKALMTLLASVSQEKYCGHFPVFNHILSKYEIFMRDSQENLLLTNKAKISRRIQKNEEALMYSFYQKSADSYEQISKKFNKMNELLQDVNKNQIVLQDPSCILCTPVFIYDFSVQNSNPYISYLIGINLKKFVISDLALQKYVNSVCIQGGGSIIIGVQKNQGGLRVRGIRFRDLDDVDRLEKQIECSIRMVKPSCHFYVERVLVHSNLMETQAANVGLEEMRFCFRIFVRPREFNKIHYIEFKKRNSISSYQFYSLNSQKQPSKIQSENYYTKIHEQYYSQLRYSLRNCHRNMNCNRRYGYYSKIFNQLSQQGLLQRSQVVSDEEDEEQIIPQNNISFRFPNLSLLLISPKKEAQYIEDLRKALKDSKELFDISQPFPESFKDCMRSSWVISHEVTHSKLRTLINKYKAGGQVKNESISLLPISRILEVSHSKFTRTVEETLASKIPPTYLKRQGEIMDNKKHEVKKIIHLKFTNIEESIFAYLLMESFKIKQLYFVNEEEGKALF